MAAFRRKCANSYFIVNDIDHEPPHCHVVPAPQAQPGIRVNLRTLEVFWTTRKLNKKQRKCLRELQSAMLAAWATVTIQTGRPT
jgi:hypothetical protein